MIRKAHLSWTAVRFMPRARSCGLICRPLKRCLPGMSCCGREPNCGCGAVHCRSYSEVDGGHGRNYPEVVRALSGTPASEVRVTDQGELTVAVAVPIQRFAPFWARCCSQRKAAILMPSCKRNACHFQGHFWLRPSLQFYFHLLASTIAGTHAPVGSSGGSGGAECENPW